MFNLDDSDLWFIDGIFPSSRKPALVENALIRSLYEYLLWIFSLDFLMGLNLNLILTEQNKANREW